MTAKKVLGGLVLLTMACAPVAPPQPPETAEEQVPAAADPLLICKVEAARSLVGKARSETLGAQAMRLTGARLIRWIRPGDAVSMDYRTDRLNIHLDGQGRVARIDCG